MVDNKSSSGLIKDEVLKNITNYNECRDKYKNCVEKTLDVIVYKNVKDITDKYYDKIKNIC